MVEAGGDCPIRTDTWLWDRAVLGTREYLSEAAVPAAAATRQLGTCPDQESYTAARMGLELILTHVKGQCSYLNISFF